MAASFFDQLPDRNAFKSRSPAQGANPFSNLLGILLAPICSRDQERYRHAMLGDGDLFPLGDAIHQGRKMGFGIRQSNVVHDSHANSI